MSESIEIGSKMYMRELFQMRHVLNQDQAQHKTSKFYDRVSQNNNQV